MDGILLKWTNYLSGWQPRYFILEDGILSYYHSKADINNSCKGSIKVSACDIIAHPTDHTRMDIVVPGEAYYYVKASTQQDRQLWLVALGTCKARSYDTILSFSATNSVSHQLESECPAGEELLRAKKSELVMYRDLLTQQLYNIKVTLKSEPPNVDILSEASALVNVTCESFIGTLEDCMQLVDLNSYVRSKDSLSPTNKSKSFFSKGSSWGSHPMARHAPIASRKQIASRASSEEKDCSSRSNVNHSASLPAPDQDGGCRPHSLHQTSDPNWPPASPKPSTVPSSPHSDTTCDPFAGFGDPFVFNGHVVKTSTDANHVVRVPTFFSQVPTSFLDLKLTDEMEIPTVPFLDACRCLVSVFDKLNEQAFIIGKLDIFGNIRKIHQKYTSSPESFPTLQKMVIFEIKRKEAEDFNSATVALLWLCKSLEFTQELMLRLANLEGDLSSDDMRHVVGDVYEKVLKNYHCWVVRSAFYMILPSIPSLHQIVSSLTVDSSHVENPNFRVSLKSDINDYLVGLKSILHLLQMFFNIHQLKIKEEVD